ncbi:ABC transporter ATP-binding protein [Allocoleopsis franciscana]|uniref:ATPase component of various ABC-type transport systems with duplicated ATPase domain n=1 Tax=Allocoleopsis franciscana PCC 7113 TaxID=1173027 RepID=K9WA96_9CYAN|nr:ABC transporter ATP-binding protein [Allocoleopsis franciscana]AFZ16684.1 ATPase component of various ABC-type transport systems with duplicated ATPase domain [Allocoleopsis franciscana PCC 7113]
MTDNVLDVRNLKVEFHTDEKRVLAVDGIDFKLQRGQTLGIVGESGSGKSVTSLAVMGLVPSPGKITAGEIYFRPSDDGSDSVDLLALHDERKRLYRGGKISMIFQEPMTSLNPVYTCGFQLVEAIRQHQDISEAEARRQAIARLQEVKLIPGDEELKKQYLEELIQQNPSQPTPGDKELYRHINQQKQAILERYPHELSGGQLQRVMIAMAISCNPDVLIADEPTTALDVTVQAAILDLLRELRDNRGMSILFITHDLGVIAEIADSVAVMYQGKIVDRGDVWEIFSNPQHPYTKGLLACRPRLERRMRYLPTVSDFMEVVTTASGELEIREKPVDAKLIAGEEDTGDSASNVTASPRHSVSVSSSSQVPLLAIRDLQVGFPVRGVFGTAKRYIMAVNGISFEVYPGETLGLVGESGCGKSTLARTLLRLIEPISGEMEFEGRDITALKGNRLRQLRREMQIVFQNPFSSLDPRMKIGKTVMEPLVIHEAGGNKKTRRDRAAYLLQRVGLNPDLMNRYPHEFSGGQRQRICIARALALNPKFIICDESVSALDVSVQAQVLNLLKELQSEFGLTYIFISHDLSVVKFMSDRIMVMNQGKIEEIGSAQKIYREPSKDYTRQLIASIPTGTLERIQQQQERRQVSEVSAFSDPWSSN